MCNNQILATIYEIMKFNQISLEDLIEFIDIKQTPIVNTSYSSNSKINWGDEAFELDLIKAKQQNNEQIDEQVYEQINEQNNEQINDQVDDEPKKQDTSSWVSVIKKIKNSPLITKKVNKQQSKITDDCLVIYSVDEFIQCIKEKKKLHIDFIINPESHCEHTFNGTLCENVKECGKIHIQRCMHNLDCQYKYCQFLHVNDMPNDIAKNYYMDSMDEYNKIKKNKKVYV